MNIILVKHPDSAKLYCFSVPDHLATSVRRGSKVICNTARGMEVGIVKTGVITGSGAEDVARLNGARFPLADIDGVFVDLPMEEIGIPDYIAKSIPATEKIAKRLDEYRKCRAFFTSVVLNREHELIDGYSAYLVAKMLDLKYLPVYVRCFVDDRQSGDGKRAE